MTIKVGTMSKSLEEFSYKTKLEYYRCTPESCCFQQRVEKNSLKPHYCFYYDRHKENKIFEKSKEVEGLNVHETVPEICEFEKLTDRFIYDGESHMFFFKKEGVGEPFNDTELLFFPTVIDSFSNGKSDAIITSVDQENRYHCENLKCCINPVKVEGKFNKMNNQNFKKCKENLSKDEKLHSKEICDYVPNRFCSNKKMSDYCSHKSESFTNKCTGIIINEGKTKLCEINTTKTTITENSTLDEIEDEKLHKTTPKEDNFENLQNNTSQRPEDSYENYDYGESESNVQDEITEIPNHTQSTTEQQNEYETTEKPDHLQSTTEKQSEYETTEQKSEYEITEKSVITQSTTEQQPEYETTEKSVIISSTTEKPDLGKITNSPTQESNEEHITTISTKTTHTDEKTNTFSSETTTDKNLNLVQNSTESTQISTKDKYITPESSNLSSNVILQTPDSLNNFTYGFFGAEGLTCRTGVEATYLKTKSSDHTNERFAFDGFLIVNFVVFLVYGFLGNKNPKLGKYYAFEATFFVVLLASTLTISFLNY